MPPKRFPSSLLVDTIIEEEKKRKKKREESKVTARVRRINRLNQQTADLRMDVENLQWKKRKMELEQQQLAVENAREEGRREGRRAAMSVKKTPQISPPVMIFAPPTAPTPSPHCVFLPSPMSYTPMYSPPANSMTSFVPEYVPQPVNNIPAYTPTRISPIQDSGAETLMSGNPMSALMANPISSISQRHEHYWRRFAAEINKNCPNGKRLFQNPVDNLTFRVQNYKSGVVKVYVGGEWFPIKGYNKSTP